MRFLAFRAHINHNETRPDKIFEEGSSNWYLECGHLLDWANLCYFNFHRAAAGGSKAELKLSQIKRNRPRVIVMTISWQSLCVVSDWGVQVSSPTILRHLASPPHVTNPGPWGAEHRWPAPSQSGSEVITSITGAIVQSIGYTHVNLVTNPGNSAI